MNIIEFKNLGLRFIINPVVIKFFGIKIHWYGLIIATGFLLGLLVAMYFADKYKLDKELIIDFILIATPFAIIGARIYYVIFSFSEYRQDFWEIFRVWHGGLAIYGAIIGGLIAVLIYAKYRNVKILPLADIASPSFILGQAIGRWGNFVNVEAYGSETSLPWAMTIIENGVQKSVHPTFLYESLFNFLVFIILLFFIKYKKNDGEVFYLYIGLYSFGRLFIEGLRTDSLYFGSFRISQIIALIFICISTIIFIKNRNNSNSTS